jgi:hypothetical protein
VSVDVGTEQEVRRGIRSKEKAMRRNGVEQGRGRELWMELIVDGREDEGVEQ